MSKRLVAAPSPLVALLFLLLASRPAPAEDRPEKPTLYAVVQVGDAVEVLPADEVKARKEAVAEADKADAEKWNAAKKAAAKAKEKFAEPKPKKTSFKVHGAKYKSPDEANEAKAKIEEKLAKKGAKKGGGRG